MLTTAQIVQFLIGVGLTLPLLFMEDCLSVSQQRATLFCELYALPLIALFVDFYQRSYRNSGKIARAPKQE